MIELSRHIEILLLDNDCVIVPGFGGFMAHHRPAEYVEEEGMFYPPQRTLGFNPQLKLNDSLLAQSYVEAYDISYPEAVRRIDEEVEEVKQKLSIEGHYEFHGIGTITQKADERMEFEPCTAGLLTPSLYALNSFAFDYLISEKLATINIPVTPANNVEQELEEENVTLDEDVEMEYDAENDTIHISIQTLRNIVAAAMVLLMVVFASIPAGRGSSNVSMCSVIDTELIASLVNTNSMDIASLKPANKMEENDSAKAVNVALADSVAESKVAAEAPVEAKAEKTTSAERFTIVMASRVSKAGAEYFVENLKKEGLKETEIYENGNMRKVIYGNYKSEKEAQNSLRSLRESNEKFAEAWVSKI